MRRLALFPLLLLTGCSTAPIAGFLDWVDPSKPTCAPSCPPPSPGPVRLPPPDLGPREALPPPVGLSDPIPPSPSDRGR